VAFFDLKAPIPKSLSQRKGTSNQKLESHLLVVWAVVQLVWRWCVGVGRVEHEVDGWELRGLVRVAFAGKNTKAH
jgi:hypothetical protein